MQYQNMPIDDETATFKYSQMKKVDKDFIEGKPINWFLLIDPAISQETYADDTAFVVAGFDQFKNIYVKEVVHGKFTPSEIVDTTFRLYDNHRPRAIGLETVAFQKTLQYAMNDMMKERGWWLPLKEIKRKSSLSKEQRIRGLQPYYEYGHVYHLKNARGIDELEYQLIHFPKGQKDDIIDALADILEIGYSPDSRQKTTNEDRAAKQKRLQKMMKPRSRVTNY
jgi:predicted phage terminase large subunit-like protein